jgi:hypothetical protein
MTKKQRRDKESNAKSHRKKIDGRRSSVEGVPAFRLSCRGIVKLARRWPRGKVTKKARIPVGSLPVVRCTRTVVISLMCC